LLYRAAMSGIEKKITKRKQKTRERPLSSFVQETSLHGFPNIHHSKSTGRKIFWIVVILLSGVAVVYEIYKVIGDYNERPILTLYDFNNMDELMLPQVTLCSENLMINYTKLRELKIHPQIVEFAKSRLAIDDKFSLGAFNRAFGVKYPDYYTVFSMPTRKEARDQLFEVLNKFRSNTTYASFPDHFEAIFKSLQAELIALFSKETVGSESVIDYFALHFASLSKYLNDEGFDSWKFFSDTVFDLNQVSYRYVI
jgi:hypothetical protein